MQVIDGFLKNHALEGGDFLLGKDISCESAPSISIFFSFFLTSWILKILSHLSRRQSTFFCCKCPMKETVL